MINLTHPFGISLREVVINGYNMTTLPSPACHCHEHSRSEGLAFACRHLGDTAAFESQGAGNLNRKRSFPDFAKSNFPNQGKRIFKVRSSITIAAEYFTQMPGSFTKFHIRHL